MLNNVIGIAGSLISSVCVVSGEAALLFVGRALSGINSGISIGVASIYLTEIAPRNLRGVIGACHQLAVTMGILISYVMTLKAVLNTETLWPIAFGIGAIPPVLSLMILPFCPESARFLYLLKHKEEEARSAFQKLNGNQNVDLLIAEMEGEQDAARNQPKFHFIQLFRQKDLRMPITIAVLIQILQQLSGINAVNCSIKSQYFYICSELSSKNESR